MLAALAFSSWIACIIYVVLGLFRDFLERCLLFAELPQLGLPRLDSFSYVLRPLCFVMLLGFVVLAQNFLRFAQSFRSNMQALATSFFFQCLPSGLYKARTGQVVAQTGPEQEILSLPGIYFFDGWRVHPTLPIPDHLPRAKEAPVQDIALTAPAPGTEPKRSPEEEARDILARAAKNQPEDEPNTRRAAVRACKYLRAMVNQYSPPSKQCI